METTQVDSTVGEAIHLPTFIAVLALGFMLWAGFSTFEFYDNKNNVNSKLDSINSKLTLSAEEYKKVEQDLYVLGKEYNELTRSVLPPANPNTLAVPLPNSLHVSPTAPSNSYGEASH